LGMEYFKQQSVEYAVIETGLGGRLDATNVVDPIVSVITNVSMDHENILGDNLTTIAGEKAGIIKPKRPTLLGKNSDVVRQVIEQKCQHVKAPFINVPDRVKIQQVVPQGLSQHVSIGVADKTLEIDLPLLGRHQVENFTNVLATLDELGFKLDAATIQKGLDEMIWLGRMQVLEKNHPVMYDVAHNPEGLDRLLESLNELDRGNTIIVAAFNARKNIRPMLDMLENWTGNVIFTIFAGHSAVERETLMHLGVNSDMISSNLENAYIRALELRSSEDQAICFIGSHYLAETLFPMFE